MGWNILSLISFVSGRALPNRGSFAKETYIFKHPINWSHPIAQWEPLTKEIRLKIFHPIISNSFPVRYYGISGTNLPDIPQYISESRLTYGILNILSMISSVSGLEGMRWRNEMKNCFFIKECNSSTHSKQFVISFPFSPPPAFPTFPCEVETKSFASKANQSHEPHLNPQIMRYESLNHYIWILKSSLTFPTFPCEVETK